MGRMKEMYMQMVDEEYNGDHDAFIQELARVTCEEFVYQDSMQCPNCHNHSIHRNETDIVCDVCAQEFILVEGNTLRFK